MHGVVYAWGGGGGCRRGRAVKSAWGRGGRGVYGGGGGGEGV